MKIKNAKFYELHIEKIVLGAAAVFSLAAIGLYAFNSFDVEVRVDRKTTKLSPTELEKQIQSKAKKLKGALGGKQSVLKDVKVVDYQEAFARRQAVMQRQAEAFPVPFGDSALDPRIDVTRRDDAVFVVAEPPAPTDLRRRADYAVLMANEDMFFEVQARLAMLSREGDQAPADPQPPVMNYAKLVPEEGPRDFWYVSFEADFDFEQWTEQIEQVDLDKRVPRGWWQGRQLVTDVVVERQAMDPLTGRWPMDDDFEVVDALPDSVKAMFRPMHDRRQWDAESAGQVLRDIRLLQSEIALARFAPVTEIRPWQPFDEATRELSEDEERELNRIQTQIRSLQKRITRARQNLLQRQADEERKRERGDLQQGRKQARPVKDAGPGIGRGNKRRDDDGRDRVRPILDPVQKAQQELEVLEFQLTEALDKKLLLLHPELAEEEQPEDQPRPRAGAPRGGLGGIAMRPGVGGGLNPFGHRGGLGGVRRPRFDLGMAGQRGPIGQDGEEQEPQKMKLIAHDITVRPGVTYRYRLRVRVLNPLFQQNRLIKEQLENEAKQLAVDSQPTPWSEPISIEPRLQFFVMSVRQSDGTAKVLVYGVHNGRRHREEFTISPGDPIGGPVSFETLDDTEEMDMYIGAVAVDVEQRPAKVGNNHVLMYFDQDNQTLDERIAEVDRNNPKRYQLDNEILEAEEQLEMMESEEFGMAQ